MHYSSNNLTGISGSNPAGVIDVCVLLGRGLCDGPIPRRGQSCDDVCVCVCVVCICVCM